MDRIITNGKVRDMFSGFEFQNGELRSKLMREFDYLTEEEFDMSCFFQYRRSWYDMGQFVRIEDHNLLKKGWQGIMGQSAWDSLIISIRESARSVVVGRLVW